MATVNLTNLQLSETEVLQRLLQLYYFESTSWSKEDICSTGLYEGCTAADLALYVDSATAKAYLIWLNEVLVGFVLLDWIELEQRAVWELADFFILPKYRGGWIALEAVRQVIAQVAQPMAASTFKENKLALRFFTAVSKRIRLDSVREVEEEETSPFYTFMINEIERQEAKPAG